MDKVLASKKRTALQGSLEHFTGCQHIQGFFATERKCALTLMIEVSVSVHAELRKNTWSNTYFARLKVPKCRVSFF